MMLAKKKILSVFLILTLIFTCTGCGKETEELVMATEPGFAPYEYYQNGKIVGVDIEIAEEIAKRLDKKLVVKDVSFDFLINEIKSGKADFAAAGISITEERKKEVDFTNEYTTSNQVVIVNKDTTITSFEQLETAKIAVQLGTVADMYASDEYQAAEVIKHKKVLSAVEAVKSKKADCIILDQLPAKEIVKANPNLKILDGVLFQDKYGMIVKKGNTELLNQINEILADLEEEGVIDELVIKHSSGETSVANDLYSSFYNSFIAHDRYLIFKNHLLQAL